MNWLGRLVQKEIESNDIVLDLGCGIMQATTDILYSKISTKRRIADLINYKMEYSGKGNLICKSILGCDIWPDYLKVASKRYPTIKLEMNELDKFVDDSYDVIICLDVLEHLDVETVNNTIKEMQRIARKKVIVYTPSEMLSNEEHVENSWGMGMNPHQIHKCLVKAEFLKSMGFELSYPEPDRNTFGVWTKWKTKEREDKQ